VSDVSVHRHITDNWSCLCVVSRGGHQSRIALYVPTHAQTLSVGGLRGCVQGLRQRQRHCACLVTPTPRSHAVYPYASEFFLCMYRVGCGLCGHLYRSHYWRWWCSVVLPQWPVVTKSVVVRWQHVESSCVSFSLLDSVMVRYTSVDMLMCDEWSVALGQTLHLWDLGVVYFLNCPCV